VWEALTGASLFDRDTDFLIWKAITEAPIPPLAPHGMPAAIDAVLASALERDRTRRFRSARALGEALRNAAEKVGGAMSTSEIAEIVKSMCGDQLAQRARDVASVVSGRKSAPKLEEPSAADTIEDAPGSTMNLRPGSVKVTRQPPVARSRWPLVVGGLGAIGGVVAMVLALRSSGEERPAPPPHNPIVAPAPTPTPASERPPVPGPLEIVGEARALAVCPSGETCVATCITGDCKLRCEAGSTCTAVCSGGRCTSECAPGATCTFGCGGGHCTTDCPDGAKCTRTCAGGTCTAKPGPTNTAKAAKPVKKADAAVVSPPAVASEPGTFSIDSSPYATIYLDGTKLGDTPLFGAKVPAGRHQIRAVLEDGTAKTFSVEIAPGKLTNKGKLTW
jgi:serine/threonine-protein kinase